jgi:NAD+ kinase
MAQKFKKVGVIAFKPKPPVIEALRRFLLWSQDKKVGLFFHNQTPRHHSFPNLKITTTDDSGLGKTDIILAFGGDGTLLSTARRILYSRVPIAGINVGSLGFLTDIPLNDLEHSLDKIFSGKCNLVDRTMLDVTVIRKDKQVWKNSALNEVVVHKASFAKLLSLTTFSGTKYISRFWVDGLIVATPTGSTAYSLSSGGPLLYPTLDAVVLTPICPHALTERPMVLPAVKMLRIIVEDKKPPALVTVDSKEHFRLVAGDSVCIKKSKAKTRLVKLSDINHFDTLRDKLGWSKK